MQVDGPLSGAPLGFPRPALSYTVSNGGNPGAYSSIQAAIDAAKAAGASPAAPAEVIILAGVYEENVQLRSSVAVRGLLAGATTIRGTVTCDLEDEGGIENTVTALRNVTIEAPPGQRCFEFTGTTAQSIFLLQSQLFAQDQPAVLCDNTGTDGGELSFLATSQVLYEVQGGGVNVIEQQAGFMATVLCNVTGDPTQDALRVSGGAEHVGLESQYQGRVLVEDGFGFFLRPQIQEVSGQAAFEVGPAGFALWLSGIAGTDTSPAIAGTGAFAYDLITYQNAGAGIDPGLLVVGPFRVQGAETLLYTPTPAQWVGAPPTTVQATIDRMAALLVTLNAGPIP